LPALEAARGNHGIDRSAWAAAFARVRAQTMALTAPLSAEDQAIQSMPDVSPTKWHLAHTAWFFETFVLKPHARGYAPYDESFGYLFNSYYEAEGARPPRAERGLIARPDLAGVHAYRGHVDAAMTQLIETADTRTWAAFARVLELGCQHEQQHQELILMDIKHVLAQSPAAPNYGARRSDAALQAPPLQWIAFPGGLYEIGHDGAGFAFDNEAPRHKVWLEPFKLASRASTNGEYAAFIADGGYRRAELWLSDGWAAVNAEGWRAPLYWRGQDGAEREFTLGGERRLDPDEPVCHLSYYEADAFARWAGKRLPREAEWEAAAAHADDAGQFADAGEFHPRPAAHAGLAQMFGDVWEWTQSAYSAYPRYRPAAGALGEYNGKFMCNQFVLRGGAAVTPPGHIRPTYRNFFPPQARWAFSGVRLADDDV